ncbi:hypothetical protein DFW101_2741 [Solidesulfovibrio carbinoliphilus subsp. oakridgensis]|uniref:Uncharacterized protein n=1 Tax=Solidesulfovibrio carbinoliphilus subsp. oakridgensis TaxID=694327 RepID=G7QAJ2_9BACT|nr:hypothetical protein [Solidesulfovibrio carbinoliphilus]EHJ48745.1 hypothetical protein DFW101_2741 [Solidesulfovibrio carbinoliphilus subsp. oakridgensis]
MDPIEKASEEIFRVFMVEHWARFYFAVEQDGVVFLDVPEEAMAELKAEHPFLAEFVASINGQPIDMESSRRAIGEFVFRSFEGGTFPQGTMAKAFDSKPFAMRMRLFSVWLSGHEGQLDAEPMPFAVWDTLFAQWRQDPAVLRFAASLAAAGNPEVPSSGSVH